MTRQQKRYAKRLLDLAWSFLAAIGAMFIAAFVGMYLGGFFHWAAVRHPDNLILNLLFGAAA